MWDPREHGRVGDLVAVQVQHRQHGPVARRIEELVRVPACGQRAGLGLPVAHHAQREQVGVVQHGAVGVHERVSELTALVDRAGRLGRDVAGDPARERELAKQSQESLLVAPDVRVDLAVGPVEIRAGDEPRTAVTWPGDIDRVQPACADRPVHVKVEEVQTRGRAPVAEQPRLDVLGAQWLAEKGVVEQVDLPDRQVVRGAPPCVHRLELPGGQWTWTVFDLSRHIRGIPNGCRADVATR